MKYSDYRDKIKSGDVLAWTDRSSNRSFASFFIRQFTQSEYHHVGIAWVVHGRVFVLEAKYPYVRIVPLSNLLPCYLLKMGDPLSELAVEKALSMVGTAKYSIPEAMKSYFKLNEVNNRWQCVEYVKTILHTNGLDIQSKDTPSDLVLEIQKLGKSLIYLEED